MQPTYVPTWARLDNPTRHMSEADMRAYYKAQSAAGDCRFALECGSPLPLDIQAVYRALLAELDTRKSTPADKALIASLRQAWGRFVTGCAYTVPVFVSTIKQPRKARKASCCPNCGHAVAA